MRWPVIGFVIGVWALAAPARGVSAQQDTTREPGAAASQREREEQLRARIMGRFLDEASRDLELTEDQSRRLSEAVRASHEERRSLIREQRAVRLRLEALTLEGKGSDAEARELLDRAARLKAREAELWREEQERIARVLTPAQQARFLVLQERFAQRVRELRRERTLQDRRARPEPQRPRKRPRTPTRDRP